MTWLLFLLACDPKDQDLPPDETIEDTGDPQATEDTASTAADMIRCELKMPVSDIQTSEMVVTILA